MSHFFIHAVIRRSAAYIVKKINDFPVPSRDVTNQTLPGREYLIISGHGETLVSDNPAGDGKIANLFYSVGKKMFFLFNKKKTITEEMKYVSLLGSNRLASYLENSSFVSKGLSSK